MENKIKMGVEQELPLEGLGGWLIIAMIGLILSPVQLLVNLSNLSELSSQSGMMKEIGLSMGYFTVARIGYWILLILSFIMLYLFFTKKKMYVYSVYLEIAVSLSFLFTLIMIVSDVPEMKGSIVMLFIWSLIINALRIMYYTQSVRVKNTFVN
jgi:hypothetical protein